MSLEFTMPQIGYGTWNRDGEVAYRGVSDALEIGYRHIDTAQAYGNEEFVGAAILESGIARDDVFLCTKVDPVNFAPGNIRPSVEHSLEKLRVDRVDLLLLHFPSIHDEFVAEEYIQQFAEVFDSGLSRHIGVSNFTKHYLNIALKVLDDRPLRMNQVELHAYMQNRPIVSFCREHGIALTAYSPLARGALIDDPVLMRIAETHSVTSSQVALAFLLAEGFAVIPSSVNKVRSSENFLATHTVLSEGERRAIRALDRGLRLVDEDWCPKWD